MKYNTDVRCTMDAVAQIGQNLFDVVIEIGIKFTITDCSNFDKRCSGAHFVSFLFYYSCTYHVKFVFDRNFIFGIFRKNLATFCQNAASKLALVRETTSNGIQMK